MPRIAPIVFVFAALTVVAPPASPQSRTAREVPGARFQRSLLVLKATELTAEFPCLPNCQESSLPSVAREAWLIWRRHPEAQSYTLAEPGHCLIEANRLPTDTVALVRIIVHWQPTPEPPVTCAVRVNALRDVRIRRVFK
jgi:hypothetical protein